MGVCVCPGIPTQCGKPPGEVKDTECREENGVFLQGMDDSSRKAKAGRMLFGFLSRVSLLPLQGGGRKSCPEKSMATIRVTKEFGFAAAHALYNYDGECSNIHGHSYRLFVTVKGEPISAPGHPKNGMVVDFSVLKDIVNRRIVEPLDHSFMVYAESPQGDISRSLAGKGVGMKIVECHFPPTCEMLLADFAERIRGELPQGVTLEALRLYETASSYAEWFAQDNPR